MPHAILASAGVEDESVSVWMDAVYEPGISGEPGTNYKKPGCGPG